ncbi:hypothetical protein FVF58_09615 [Paraburkholderia panacisoli]|uniref:Uncharacterized protein n=1 Tax=Paraburkholderia panacisoli TaxID=2603818 RepID=A0A5B0HDC0_9BURK|nr:hypothetical protein [Paraburkholderia panacisoli]KAA1013038.1 hypothetical protein FVF58_09615 [Paraburkholderia panacisoli]
MDSLYLDPATWDLAVDASGSIAVCADPYALAQNAATAIRTFLGEVYYDTTIGVPYWSDILGHFPSLAVVKADLVAAAETVTGVTSAQVFITSVVNRQLSGQVQVTDANGNVSAASF